MEFWKSEHVLSVRLSKHPEVQVCIVLRVSGYPTPCLCNRGQKVL